jgi:peptide deformylase
MPQNTPKEIVQEGAPVLREKAKPIGKEDFGSQKLRKVIAEMRQALEKCDDGVAIAAPQIGHSLRLFVVSHRAFTIDAAEDGKELIKFTDRVFINPRITKTSKRRIWVPEGCLSVRWLYGNVPRHDKATVEAYDEHGKKFTLGGSGLIAQIFQHEIDHLDGILFVDTAKDIEEIPPEEMEKLAAHRPSP